MIGAVVAAQSDRSARTGPLVAAPALLAATIAAGLYAALAAWGETRHGMPMLISTLLLSYPAVGVASYLARFPLRDTATGLPQTAMIPEEARLWFSAVALTVGLIIIAAIAIARGVRRSPHGGRLRVAHHGLNRRFAGYGGVRLERQALSVMFERGDRRPRRRDHRARLAVPFHRRQSHHPRYTGRGLIAALLAGGEPAGAILAGLFFAALQTGGFAMQRETSVPRVLTIVLQSIVILFLALRGGTRRAS